MSSHTHSRLDEFFRLARMLYNAALEERIDMYRKTGRSPSFFDQCKSLTVIRKDDPAFGEYGVVPFRSVLKRLDWAYRRFFAHGGFPRFKGIDRGIRSFEVNTWKVFGKGRRHAIVVKGFGRFVVRSIPGGTIRAMRIVRSALRVTVQFIVEHPDDTKISNSEPVGIDMGVRNQATPGNGDVLRGLVPDLTRATRLQRKLSRAVKGSRSRQKKKPAYAKERERVRVATRNMLHRVGTRLVGTCGPNLAAEKLQVGNMFGNRSPSKAILEQNWGQFLEMLGYKAESAGGSVVRVDPANTSRTCSRCGSVKDDLTLRDRVYECDDCGLRLDRDWNAAMNIRNRGWPLLSGGDVPDVCPDVSFSPAVASGSTRNSLV